MSSHHHEKIMLDGPVGHLQALYQPGQAGKPAVVVCHPHPLYGGTMRNKVVYWMARTFEDMGCSVLRFNFRGVEESDGHWDHGRGEADDVLAALFWLEEQHPDVPLWFAGFSFGNYAGLQAVARHDRVERMFCVAPAVNIWDFSFIQHDPRPMTVIQGTADDIVPFEEVQAWVNTLAHVRFHRIEGAGHFFPEHMQHMTAHLQEDAGL